MLSLVAGGLGGPGNADGVGQTARFNGTCGAVLDGAGSLYIAMCNDGTVRKLALATGVVTTVVGAHDRFGSVDGIGAAARFSNPRGLAADGAGNLYLADVGNHTIRKISLASLAVSTVAGAPGVAGSTDGTGSAARFLYPSDVATDGAGTLYVADSGNVSVRRIVLATGAVSTLAGSPGMLGSSDGVGAAARFISPGRVAADRAGNVYVADSDAHTIRKIVVATRTVSTLAGTAGVSGSADGTGAAALFTAPAALAFDGVSSLLVTDNGSVIRRIGLATGAVSTLAGAAGQPDSIDGIGSAARFASPGSLATDGTTLYVGQALLIRKVELATASVTTVAGSLPVAPGSADGTGAAARFNAPDGVAADQDGNVYVSDAKNHTIRKVELATGVTTTLAGQVGITGSADGVGTSAQFNRPSGLAVDDAGNLYVADRFNCTIRKLVLATGAVSTIAGSVGTRSYADGTSIAAHFSNPAGLALDGKGNLFVADAGNKTIRKIVLATRSVTTVAGSPGASSSVDGTGTAALFQSVNAIAVDASGNLYATDNGKIRKVVPATGAVTTLADTYNASSLTIDGAGTLFIGEPGTVRRFDPATSIVSAFVGEPGVRGVRLGLLPGALTSPTGLAVAPGGVLVILEASENAVLAVR